MNTRCGVAMQCVVGLSIVLGVTGYPVLADVFYVPEDFNTIQAAIEGAADGDEIVVAPGQYNEAIDFLGRGITLRASGDPAGTVIDAAGLSSPTVAFVSGEGPEAVLEGFTITGGSGTGFPPIGGGILVQDSSPHVRDCIIVSNTAYDGAGVALVGDSDPVIIDSSFVANSASSGGGAIYHYIGSSALYENCVFVGNSGRVGGAGHIRQSATATFQGCTFADNEGFTGGALRLSGHTLIEDCTFEKNFAEDSGGAILLTGSGTGQIRNTSLIANSAEVGAGAIHCSGCSLFAENLLIAVNVGGTTGAVHAGSSTGFRIHLKTLKHTIGAVVCTR